MTGTVIWSVLGFRKIALCPFLQKRTDSATPRWVLCHTNTVQINDLDLHVSTWVNFINKILNFWRFAVAERYWIILFTYILTIKKHLCLLWKCKNRNEGQAWITVYWSLLKRRPVTGPQGFQYLCSQDRLYHLGSFFFFGEIASHYVAKAVFNSWTPQLLLQQPPKGLQEWGTTPGLIWFLTYTQKIFEA